LVGRRVGGVVKLLLVMTLRMVVVVVRLMVLLW
jgi:hypothetical protein